LIQKAEQNGCVGVVLCDCGGTLRNNLDFDKLQQLPGVIAVEFSSKFCRREDCAKAIDSLSRKKANRIVVGACDQQVFDKNLQHAIDKQGLNRGLVWCVNIREQCAWVTKQQKPATDKAMQILTAAVRRMATASPISAKATAVNQNVLVIGYDAGAMQTAVGLSQLGHQVTMVTNGKSLGAPASEMPQLYAYLSDDPASSESLVRDRVDRLKGCINNSSNISIKAGAILKSVQGQLGNFTALIDSRGTEEKLSAGAVVLAAGAANNKYELAVLIKGREIPRRIAIVIDIGGEQGPVVSAQVLSAALLLAERYGAEVKLYCHNVRVATMGLEGLYRHARQAGVVVVKYESPPDIIKKGRKTVVRVEEPTIGEQVEEEFDLVITADTHHPANGDNKLAVLIKALRPGPEGALQADNIWLLATKTNRQGIFTTGPVPGADEIRDVQADGLTAANQIHELLKNKQIEVFDDAAVVDKDKCVLCLTCVRVCPYGAVSIDTEEEAASISQVSCRRCGICAAQCPAAAIQLPQYTDTQISAEIGDKPQITVFACENSAFPAATAAGINGCEYDARIRLIRVPCAGRVEPRQVLQALELGAQKVMILGCHPESCQYLDGSTRAQKRTQRLVDTLKKAAIVGKQVVFGQLASVEPGKFIEYVKE
jgi:heterodisulfide reductase subunit A-like polyferredoxin/coenzyme F420-reducing hydrogenase delta subunit